MNYKKCPAFIFQYVKHGFDVVLPPRCPQTGKIVARSGDLSVEAWRDLTFIGDPQCQGCGLPFEVIESDDAGDGAAAVPLFCGACLERPRLFRRARSALVYDDYSRRLILSFKHGDQTHLISSLVPLLARSGRELLAAADVLVPVPLHWTRLVRRRYNQSALLGRALARVCDLPFGYDVLTRVRATVPQGHKSGKERYQNVKGAFAVSVKRMDLVEGKSVLLIDDVYTTGATVEACADALLKGGARQVDILTVARVVKS